ncbi:MAG: hypothetical protein KGI94_15575 [Paracoccaceae bacterium]|nr:hypothetical protein [Paracoccaceae bacterium]
MSRRPLFLSRSARPALIALAVALPAAAQAVQSADTLSAQWAAYQAVKPKSVLDLQPFRETTTAKLSSGAGLSFVSVNPNVNAWFLATIEASGADPVSYHIENPHARTQTVALVPGAQPKLALGGPQGDMLCDPWTTDLPKARATRQPYAPICGGRLYLRNPAVGHASTLESVTDFLRNNIWGGDAVVNFVKDTLYKDAFQEKANETADAGVTPENVGPGAALVEKVNGDYPAITGRTGLTLTGVKDGRMALGLWYPVTGLSGVYASAMEPRALAKSVLESGGHANALDNVERTSVDYLAAFDLSKFNVGYAVGTAHPDVGWSPRPPASMQNPSLPGPDGIGTVKPLVRTGMIDPALASKAIATFTGGFKREHGAFKHGPFSERNAGSHYGFVEQGAILSKLQPGLATLYVLADGTIGMKTWEASDDAMLPQVRFARQNGVPLVVTDPKTGKPVPGDYVSNWAFGNWSGSAEAHLRTLRAGACMKTAGDKRFLIYGYFSTVTPSGMARVFQSYGCNYAMILDMNAIVHTYMGLYVRQGNNVQVEHMVPAMAKLDKEGPNGAVQPRFLSFPDNRDFFYLTQKD